jgi:hypothetical protein
MSLQTNEDLNHELAEIDALAAEHSLGFAQAARAHWFGYRPGDGFKIDPLFIDLSKTTSEIIAEMRAMIGRMAA